MNSSDLILALKAAGEPSRLRMLLLCQGGELTVGEITRILGQSQPRVSRHLKILCDAKLLERFRERHSVYYRVPANGPFAALVAQLLASIGPEESAIEKDADNHRRVLEERVSSAGVEFERDRNWTGSAGSAADEGRIRWAVLNLLGDSQVGRLLDVGTGSGRMLRLLGRRTGEAVGVDISARVLAGARGVLHGAGLRHCTLRQGDMYALPFADAEFDTVTFDEVLSIAERPDRALAEAARVLKPGARILIVDRIAGNSPGLDTAGLAAQFANLGMRPLRSVPLRLASATLMVMLVQISDVRRPAA